MIDLSFITGKMFIMALAIFLLIVIIMYLYFRHKILNDLKGLYVAPETFAHELGLQSQTFIVTDISYFGTVGGFLVLDDITIPYEFTVPLLTNELTEVPIRLTYDVEDEESLGIPKKMMLTCRHGHLILEDEDDIYVLAQWVPVY